MPCNSASRINKSKVYSLGLCEDMPWVMWGYPKGYCKVLAQVLDLVLNRKGTRTEIFWIVSKIQASLKRLQQSKIQYALRNYNGVAHLLAKTALEQENIVSWFNNIPNNFLYLFSYFDEWKIQFHIYINKNQQIKPTKFA